MTHNQTNKNKSQFQAGSELTKLKEIWRELSEDARDKWRELFDSSMPQEEKWRHLQDGLKIEFKHNNQLPRFLKWDAKLLAMNAEHECQDEDERQLKKQYGEDCSLEKLREEVLKRSYRRALTNGDFSAGRQTIGQEVRVKKLGLESRRVKLLERKVVALEDEKEVIKSKLTPEEQRVLLKEILK